MKKFKVILIVETLDGKGISSACHMTVSNASDTEDVLKTLKKIVESYPGCA